MGDSRRSRPSAAAALGGAPDPLSRPPRSRGRLLISCATVGLAAVLSACSSSSTPAVSSAATKRTQTPTPLSSSPSYITAVSALCEQLRTQEQQIVTSFPPHFPVQDFLRDTAQFQPLLADFDRKLALLHTGPTAAPAATAFAAYVAESTRDRAKRVVAAEQGQAAYDAEYDRQSSAYAADPILTQVDQLGFSNSCHYR